MTGLIFDLGVSDGNDTAYYLAKGFHVVGVEADPAAIAKLKVRFAEEIADGRYILLHRAVAAANWDLININVHQVYQGLSGISMRPEPGGYIRHKVRAVDWPALCGSFGTPRYVKIDVEGSELPFLMSMKRSDRRPEFISVEAYDVALIDELASLGYSRFRLIDQMMHPPQAERQNEGLTVHWPHFAHASGPFGLDLFSDGAWEDYAQVRSAWSAAKPNLAHTWYDCHAWMPRADERALAA